MLVKAPIGKCSEWMDGDAQVIGITGGKMEKIKYSRNAGT
jgi:hypothetical protein